VLQCAYSLDLRRLDMKMCVAVCCNVRCSVLQCVAVCYVPRAYTTHLRRLDMTVSDSDGVL